MNTRTVCGYVSERRFMNWLSSGSLSSTWCGHEHGVVWCGVQSSKALQRDATFAFTIQALHRYTGQYEAIHASPCA